MFIFAALTFAAACGLSLTFWWHWIPGVLVGIGVFYLLARVGEDRKSTFWRWLVGVMVGALLFLLDYRVGIFVGTLLYGLLVLKADIAPAKHH
ncbi:MAG: hypothetical protein ISR95_06645 [Candidatus Marinimicrobia bacterium]|nr:hypothetical protein [Candidatus Neomarinimicrobiota bacterium]